VNLKKINNLLFNTCNYIDEKHRKTFIYKIIFHLLRSRILNIIFRKVSIFGYKLNLSSTSILTSKQPSRPIVEIRKVNKSLKVNIFVFTSHMGSAIIEETLGSLYDLILPLIDLKCILRGYIVPPWLEKVCKTNRSVIVSHIYPERYNLLMLEGYNIKKIVIHATDPRLFLVKDTESIAKRAIARNDLDAAFQSARMRHYTPDNYLSLTLEERIKLICDCGVFDEMLFFTKGWMEVVLNRQREWSFDILVTRWDDLVLNRESYFDNIVSFYGHNNIDWENTLLSERYSIEKATSLDWKMGLSQEMIDYINSFVPNDLLDFYNWER